MYLNSREYVNKIKKAMNPQPKKKLKEKDLFYTDASNDRPYKKTSKKTKNKKKKK